MKKVGKIVKTAAVLGLALVLALLSFGCKDYERNYGVIPEGYVPSPEGKVRLTYYIASTDVQKKAINDWIRTFQQSYPDVDVQADLSYLSRDLIAAQVASRSIGDVFFLFESDVYNYAVEHKALMPLDYYVEAYNIDTSNIFSAMLEMGTIQGKLYMATCNYNHIIYYYNKDAVLSANLEDPAELQARDEWTWDTFKDYCQALTITDEASTQKQVGGTIRLGYSAEYIPFLEGYGGKWADTVNKRVNFISDKGVLDGVNEMVDFFKQNTCRFSATDITGKGARTIKNTQSQRNFADYNEMTQCVFRSGEHDNMIAIGNAYDTAGIDWDVVAVPALPTHRVGTGCSGFAVFNGTKNADAAAALALSIFSDAGQKAYHGQEGGAVPNIKTLAYDDNYWKVPFPTKEDDPINGKNYSAFISYPEADTYAFVECVIPPEVADIVKEYMQNVIPDAVNGSRSVEDTLTLLEQEANQKWETIYTKSVS